MNEPTIPVATPVEPPPPTSPQAEAASGRAVASLVFGILSIVCMGLIAGIPAIILGSMELHAIKAGKAPRAGESTAKVGYILGIVGTVLTCLSILFFILVVAFGLSLGSLDAVHDVLKSV
jgi:Domain of unknown function (DUF4190)